MYENLKKKFGQNFLIDSNILRKIGTFIKDYNLNILEIGPGDGRLTKEIISFRPKKLTLVEIDNDLVKKLIKKYSNLNYLKILNIDITKFNFTDKYDLIISNLPYNISSQILVKICLLNNNPERLILMFQKEFANRLLDKKLNAINSLVHCFYHISDKFDVSKNCFRPIPKVNSTVLHFIKKEKILIKRYELDKFIIFKRKLFSHKRKSLNYLLRNSNIDKSKHNLEKRIEDISIEELIRIYRNLTSEFIYKICEI